MTTMLLFTKFWPSLIATKPCKIWLWKREGTKVWFSHWWYLGCLRTQQWENLGLQVQEKQHENYMREELHRTAGKHCHSRLDKKLQSCRGKADLQMERPLLLWRLEHFRFCAALGKHTWAQVWTRRGRSEEKARWKAVQGKSLWVGNANW